MGRGKRWTREEKDVLAEMYGDGCSVEEMLEALPSNRSVRAVQQQIVRLGLKRGSIVPTKEKIFVPTIEAGDVMTRKEALKVLASAIKHLQAGGKVEDIEIRRLRAVAMLVRSYFMVFDSYEKYAELEERVKKLEDVSDQEDKEAASRRKAQ